MQAIYGAIESADTFVFVLTPDSVASATSPSAIAICVYRLNCADVELFMRNTKQVTIPISTSPLITHNDL